MIGPVILCVGGDARNIYVCRKLCELGKVYSLGVGGCEGDAIPLESVYDMPQKADILVLPIMSSDELDIKTQAGGTVSCAQIAGKLNKNALVCGGKLGRQVIEFFSSLGHDVKDYFAREELAVRNSVATAEGALAIAMSELGVTIRGTKTLIIGYGRVARACVTAFSALGSEVTVCARSIGQRAEAENLGCKAVGFDRLAESVRECDIVINTVPALVLTEAILEKILKDSIVIDLASKPGGTDFDAAKRLNIRAVHALALPGKVAPITSGYLIAETIENIFNERRETDVFRRH